MQSVHTWWTTASRGGTAATRRNATPVAFRLPSTAAPLVHRVTMREKDDFTPVSEWRAGLPDRDRDDVQVTLSGDRVRVLLLTWRLVGAPRRHRRPPAVHLEPGQWVRWTINYRITSALGLGAWRYELRTLNLAVAPVTADVFLGEPTHVVDERARLR